MNDCDVIGTPNVSNDENENDPQNLKINKNDKDLKEKHGAKP